MSRPKVCAICWAMYTQPNLGLRRFISTIAAMSSGDGPLGPGLRGRPADEKRIRYFRSTRALWNLYNVADLTIADSFGRRRGLTKKVINPSTKRSSVLRFGARCRERLLTMSCCLSNNDSATTARTPPGRRSFATVTKLLRPGGVRAVVAESLLLKQQLIVSNRSRQRAPNLSTLDRFVLGLITFLVSPRRLPKLSAIVKSATLYKFHKALVDRKYRILFSSAGRPRKPGPKGPSPELIAAIVEIKRRNPKFGCVYIAQQIAHTFGLDIDKDVVRRVLAKHYRPDDSGSSGPS